MYWAYSVSIWARSNPIDIHKKDKHFICHLRMKTIQVFREMSRNGNKASVTKNAGNLMGIETRMNRML